MALLKSEVDSHSGNLHEAPNSEIEEELSRIWSRVLKVENISRHDNFFDLGGSSLLATEIVMRIYDVFGVELPIRIIFELKTIKELAGEIDNIYSEALGYEMDEGIID